MKALVQRVDGAQVAVGDDVVGAIEGPGLLVLVGVTHSDSPQAVASLAAKVYRLRIFEAEKFADRLPADGPREVSCEDLQLPVLVISQFTLYGATAKGRRPTWDAAAPGPVAEPLIETFADELRQLGASVATGVFGADMRVTATNDGPFTLLVET